MGQRDERSDESLVEACLQGDEDAWGQLVDRYKGLVYSICKGFTGSDEDASDVFQEVWTQAHRRLCTVREAESVRSWLATIARHRCYHWLKKRRSLEQREQSGYDEEALDSKGEVAPVDITEAETLLRVHEAIAKLQPRCQVVIEMLFFRHPPVPYREVAERLQLNVNSVPFIRARCLKRLHRLLDDDEHDNPPSG